MADLIKKIKIKKQDGTFTDYIPIGAEAENINVDGESVELKLNKKPYYYNTIADMKADTKLKAGDMAITLGYYLANDGGEGFYKIVNDNTLVVDNGSIHNLTNGLKAVLVIINDKINVKQFGAKADKETSDYSAFVNAISYCKSSNYATLYIPEGIYLIDNHITIDFALNLEGVYSQYANQYEEINPCLKKGSIILDGYNGVEPLIKYEYQGNSTSEEVRRIWGVKISNIQFNGNKENNHIGLYLHRTGWEGSLENLRFKDFYHTALFLDRVYDTSIYSLNISTSGSHNIANNGTPNYAMVITDTNDDSSNALHIFGLHIEACRYDLKIDKSKNNEFIGCKFEDRISDNDNLDITNPNILITENAGENSFDTCMFVPVRIDRWKELNITPENAPYQIEAKTSSRSDNFLKINNCDFSTGSKQGGKFIKIGNNANKTILSNCNFFLLNTESYSLDLTNAILSNIIFTTWNIIENLSDLKNIKLSSSIMTNTIFKFVPEVQITNKYCYESGGFNIIDNVKSENYNNLFYTLTNTDNIKYDKYLSLNNSTYISTSDIVEPDWSNVDIDKSKFKYNELYCAFSQAIQIKSISNGQLGDELTIINNSSNAIVLGGVFDYYGTRIVCDPSNTSATLTLTGFQSAKLIKNGNYWKVIATDGNISTN